jgi:arylsulfatase
MYWEFTENDGQMAIRMGDWKGIRRNMKTGNLEWELYDLANDPTESENLAQQYPKIIRKINKIAKREHARSTNPNWQFEVLGEK